MELEPAATAAAAAGASAGTAHAIDAGRVAALAGVAAAVAAGALAEVATTAVAGPMAAHQLHLRDGEAEGELKGEEGGERGLAGVGGLGGLAGDASHQVLLRLRSGAYAPPVHPSARDCPKGANLRHSRRVHCLYLIILLIASVYIAYNKSIEID